MRDTDGDAMLMTSYTYLMTSYTYLSTGTESGADAGAGAAGGGTGAGGGVCSGTPCAGAGHEGSSMTIRSPRSERTRDRGGVIGAMPVP